ncbi:MAG: hypothetical protein GF387_03500 [Candidatus Portnoybacteria bacterium]|nr:hypothetical protein [Candidatus Portnoybacteria bacterium]
MECKKEENLNNCPCTYPDCPRKGVCCECIEYHRSRNELPACYFSSEVEKTYDRSVQRFIKEGGL